MNNEETPPTNMSVKCVKCQRQLECEQIDHKQSPGKLIIVSPLPFLPVLTFNICSNCCGMVLELLRDTLTTKEGKNTYTNSGIG